METFWFWTVAAAMAVLVAAWLVRGLMRGDAAAPAAAQDIQVYRDQLAEADRDLARGTLTEAEAARVKTEIARRLLEADRALSAAAPGAPARMPWAAMALVLAAMAAALALYSRVGVPWYPDLPIRERLAMADAAMAGRPSQAEAEAAAAPPPPAQPDAEFLALMEKLRAAVDPATATDLRGLDLLARNEATLGNFIAAKAAQARLVEVKGEEATAEDYATLAEMMILAAGGYISPEAEQALIAALERDPRDGMARYFSGLMFAQGGRFDRAFAFWRPLLEESPPGAPWVGPIRAQIEDVAMRAGIPYQLPDAASGPTIEDMEAAAGMTPEERQQMVEGMVAQLQERLTTEGGSAAEWARLIAALATLDRRDQAQAIYDEAKTRFAGREGDLAALAEAAAAAGLAP
ncbi:c-type cytochrome biogenesis protein CcmI [Rhodobacter sp. SGA-6-6]|uniref:c-type cytochrome biogenesis protein CcmI n=1 Tax=Rhodobacter sp. SGA-6-6 TaxID=2710882 RepID=UPI0013E9B55C|nr:c-type cytochrome biogenesis protein CcmI [Rhodobacter sp. SGA-6-6]NGM46805.1 c-type cytochrome biogenesis protein CcmI [Rhodobacter sp. SGA-6-6]